MSPLLDEGKAKYHIVEQNLKVKRKEQTFPHILVETNKEKDEELKHAIK